jgi:8-oxo-dGTP pyrophosphatase MutT (NUDIX family)
MHDDPAQGSDGRRLTSPHDWRVRIEARLANTRPRHAMEDWLTPGLSLAESRALRAYLPTAPIAAAVLIPVVERDAQLTVLLTQRASQLKNHAGQISFPGGRIEPEDAGPSAAALREAHEEIGLEPHWIEVIGRMPTYKTGSQFIITPVVALVDPAHRLKLNAFEVADAFEVPLEFLMNPAHHRRHAVDFGGIRREWFSMPYMEGSTERFVWGATAAMLRNFYRFLCA